MMGEWRHSEAEAAVVSFLAANGAGAVAHPGGTLLAHLRRTAALLSAWGARPEVVLAGWCHAAYGTDGFPRLLIGLDRRHALRALIGELAERVVYLYCSCDRAQLAEQPLGTGPPLVRDRFTGEARSPERDAFRSFMELTAANELDLVEVNPAFAHDDGPFVAEFLAQRRAWLSEPALDAWRTAYPGAAWLGGTRSAEGSLHHAPLKGDAEIVRGPAR